MLRRYRAHRPGCGRRAGGQPRAQPPCGLRPRQKPHLRQLDALATRVATELGRNGVGPEVRIGVCLPNTSSLPVALLAVLRAGGVYVPLDPLLPNTRLEHLIAAARVHIIITDGAGATRLNDAARTFLRTETFDRLPTHLPDRLPQRAADQAAYMVFTSGSTGEPKGVIVTHRGLRTLVGSLRKVLRLTDNDRLLKLATLSFDACIFELTAALSAGATLCLELQDDLRPVPVCATC